MVMVDSESLYTANIKGYAQSLHKTSLISVIRLKPINCVHIVSIQIRRCFPSHKNPLMCYDAQRMSDVI